jgi:ubiquinone/menaquinone biosynthesis C-methylase UbiE
MPIRQALYKFYWKAEKLMVPGLRSSQYAYYEQLRSRLTKQTRWLDLGCGRQVFADWMIAQQRDVIEQCGSVVGIDLDWPGILDHAGIAAKVYGDIGQLPFVSQSFDVVSANMVVEHLPDPASVLNEAHRVLAPSGVFVIHTPNFYHWVTILAARIPDRLKTRLVTFFEGRVEKDVFHTHYQMNRTSDLRRLAEQCGFTVVNVQSVSSSATLQMLGPLVLVELLYIRLIQHRRLAGLRSNLIAVLRKQDRAPQLAGD